MAAPTSPTFRKDKKDESLFDKIGGTLARKKKVKEAQEIQEEGRNAIENPTSPNIPDLGPEAYMLEDNEERTMVDPSAKEDPKLTELKRMLIDWINDILADERIIVKDLQEDLYDGLILQKLIEKLAHREIREMPEVIQSEMGQKQKLQRVLDLINEVLRMHPSMHKWTVDKIHSKNLVAILHLLVTLARAFRAPIRLPDHVTVPVIIVTKKEGQLLTGRVLEEITSINDDMGAAVERDAFDTLFDHAPDKLSVVKRSLISFVNKHLNKINLEVTDLDKEFHDGVNLVLLMGLLEGYFVPLHCFHLTPTEFDQKVHNVNFAMELMQDAGMAKPKGRAEDIVNLDLKSTLRLLYSLFTKYKTA